MKPDKKPSRSCGEKALEGLTQPNIIVIGDTKDDVLFPRNLDAQCLYLGQESVQDANVQKINASADIQIFLKNYSCEQLPNIILSRSKTDTHGH